MRHKRVRYLLYPLAYTALMILAGWVMWNGPVRMWLDEWRQTWVAAAPSYTYQGEDGMKSGVSGEELAANISPGTQYGQIVCERAGLKAPLYYGDTDEIFAKGAGTYPGAGLPGTGRTAVIGAHDATYFAALEKLKTDDEVQVDTVYGSYSYRVRGTEIVEAAQASEWMADLAQGELALYTCYPFGEAQDDRSQRYVVYLTLAGEQD